jgi:hypothetical protein
MIPTDRPVRSVERKRLTICLRIPPPFNPHGEKGEGGRPDTLGARASGAQAGETRAPRRRQRRPKFMSVARDCDLPAMLPHGVKGEGGRPDSLGARASGAQAGETPALPGGASVDRNSCRSPAIAIAPQCSHTGRRGRARRPDAPLPLIPPAPFSHCKWRCPGCARLRRAGGRDARAPRRRQPRTRARRWRSQAVR